METTSPPLCERQFDSAGSSGALFSGSEEREASGGDVVVNSDDFLVERADHPRAIPASASDMGPHVIKEIIIYVYDNDDNIVTENNVDPIPTKDGEDLNTNLGVTKNDAGNSLEEFNVAEHVAAKEGAENESLEELYVIDHVGATENGGEGTNACRGYCRPRKERDTPFEEIAKNNIVVENNVAEGVVEVMETAVSEVPPSSSQSGDGIQTVGEACKDRSLSRKVKNVASAMRVFRDASQPSPPSQLRGSH